MIKVGINENVFLAKAVFAEKESKDKKTKTKLLTLTWKELSDPDEVELSEFDALMEGELSDAGSGLPTTIFGPKNVDSTGKALDAKAIAQDFTNLKDLLSHILSAYRPLSASADGSIPAFSYAGLYDGTGIVDTTTFNKGILSQGILDKLYENMSNIWIAAITPYLNRRDLPVALLLIRQSPTKHFATLRNKFLKSNPIIEPMEVFKVGTKLKFNDYEIKKGLDKDTPATATQAADQLPEGGQSSSIPDSYEFPTDLDAPTGFGTR